MAKSSVAGLLTSVDEIFTTQEEREEAKLSKIVNMPLSLIDDFPGHPYHVRMDEDMDLLVDSVKKRGILVPVLVMPKDDGRYLMVSGHRRKKACELAGLETIRAEVRELTMDEAIVEMVDSNLQRSSILPSEKAFAYKMKLDAMKRQGYRTDLTSNQVGTKLQTDEIVAKGFGVSKTTVHRFIRLTELLLPILQMVDEGRIALTPGAELSFLTLEEQENLFTTMESEDATPSLAQAQRMKKLSQEGQLDMDAIFAIMTEEKGNQKEAVKIGMDKLRKYFPRGTTPQQMEETIIRLLKRELRRKRNRESR